MNQMAATATPKIKIESCVDSYRFNKSGTLVTSQVCQVSGTQAKIIIVDGVISGLTGNPTKEDAVKLAPYIRKSASDLLTGYKPLTL